MERTDFSDSPSIKETPLPNSVSPAAIVVQNVHKRFGHLQVLKGVSLSADEGDVIALIGSSGSGKSTLLRCINLLEIPDSGAVHIAGELIRMKKTAAKKPYRKSRVR
jgi:octopine/nopaline transport system ATP-binding protein